MTRAYRSELRTKQAASTRDQILAALVEQLAEGVEEFSIPRVADRAGVSVRTIYHYFPNRESQIEAVAEYLDTRLTGNEPGPASLTDITPMAARIVHRSLENLTELRAQLVPGVARAVREQRGRGREQAIARAVGKSCEPAAAKLAAAALSTAISADIGVALLDRYRLDPQQTEVTVVWMVGVLVDAIRRGDVPDPTPAHKRTRR